RRGDGQLRTRWLDAFHSQVESSAGTQAFQPRPLTCYEHFFNPRRHSWARHFRWEGPILVGRTAVGRATIAVLGINLAHRVRHRAQLIAEGVFPPGESAESR